MSKKHLSNDPHQIGKVPGEAWWYEEVKGIEIYIYRRSSTGGPDTKKFVIPWAEVRAALKRKDKNP